MPKKDSTSLNYRILTFSLLKQNKISLMLGTVLLMVFLILVGNYGLPRLNNYFKANLKSGKINGSKKPVPTKKIRTYTVKSGDQLFLIAEKIYGSGFNMQDIMNVNKIKDPNAIEVGQILIIPEVTPRFPTTGTISDTAASTGKVNDKNDRYIVKQGDDLAKIALETYGDSYAWVKIAEANNLVNPDNLPVGMILIIPR